MGIDYEFKIKLDAAYNQNSISKILERGTKKNFIYYDHVIGESYQTAPIINASQAAFKVIKAFEDRQEGGPGVYTIIEPECSAHLWFYKAEDGYVEFVIGGFSSPIRKGDFIDFAHYLRMFLDLCEDFPIVEIKTDFF